ncbi:MAG: NAD-dependent epimerase/dehydratase family protein [Lachnospiraceae bacterium]|nr:NAD-dependent epimerase/dehydratase family protein [Lachnospiraceae bacterium]
MSGRKWSSDPIIQEDLERIADSEIIDWEALRGKRILVTGATGLIGSIVACSLICASVKRSMDIRVAALVRSPEKAKGMLGAFLNDGLELVVGDILSPLAVDGPVDYILHGASVTTSKDFVDHPVETILTTLKGTEHLLELARQKQVKGMVYLSSMEAYGEPDPRDYVELQKESDRGEFLGKRQTRYDSEQNAQDWLTGVVPVGSSAQAGGSENNLARNESVQKDASATAADGNAQTGSTQAKRAQIGSTEIRSTQPGHKAAILRETNYGYIDPLKVRSSYSEGKRMAEGLCAAYAQEYHVPVKVARLAQTFGAGIPKTENRVFAQFAHSIMEGTDIVLHTDGSKAHCYCYTTDAVLGLLTILLRGENGEAYNVSNEETYSTIRGMAEMLVEKYPQSGSSLVFDIPEDANQYGYAPTSQMLICSEKLRKLGWKAQVGLPEMFERLMRSME